MEERNLPPASAASTGMEVSDASAGMSREECIDRITKSLKAAIFTSADSNVTGSFSDPMVRFLRKQMEQAGCPVWVRLLMAANCKNQGLAGGYSSRNGITVCCNQLSYQDEINQVIIHELIHAYDDCRAKNMDWKNCAHHACSEIRANHLSGDCHYKREMLRGFLKIRGHEQECVRRRALKSVKNNPYCSEAAAKDAIAAVWDICYEDTSPFDRAP